MTSARHGDLAVDGGKPVRTERFPTWPIWDEKEEGALLEALRSGVWGIGSPQVAQFEEEFAAFQQARYAVAVMNGTAALEVALRAVGVTYGDEVIVPPYTFIATASAVLSLGGIPVFADIEEDSLNIDSRRVEALITAHTKAIIPVHIAGRPADLDAIQAVAGRHDLFVIEDCAQAHGASWRGRRVGAIGDLGTFSFQSSKNISAGEGGAVLSNKPELAEAAWSHHNVGRIRHGAWYQHEVLGGNARMTGWQAALALAQMSRAEAHLVLRQKNAAALSAMLSTISGIEPLPPDERVTEHAYHLYCFRYHASAFGGTDKELFLQALRAEGIPCAGGYTPLYRAPAIANAGRQLGTLLGRAVAPMEENIHRCPVTERSSAEKVCWLPQNVLLGDQADLGSVAEAIAKIQRVWRS